MAMLDTRSESCRTGSEETTTGGYDVNPPPSRVAAQQRSFPPFNFYGLPLSLAARHQLSNVYKTRGCWQLAERVRKHAFNPANGYCVPISNDVYLVAKLPMGNLRDALQGRFRRDS